MHLSFKPPENFFKADEIVRAFHAHKVSVMMPMRVVVAKHPPIVSCESQWIDVSETIPGDSALRVLPELFLENWWLFFPAQIVFEKLVLFLWLAAASH